jgi:hypothetical protein
MDNIIRLAKEQGNAEAGATARKAADKAKKAREEFLALKRATERGRAQAEAALASIRSAKKGFEAGVENARMEIDRDGWAADQSKLIQGRLGSENRWVEGFVTAREKANPERTPKRLDELQPGDVLLLEGKIISAVDNALSFEEKRDPLKPAVFGAREVPVSKASHTVIYLKEVNGKKLFLDNQPAEGPRIISEEEFLDIYGHRGAEVARLVGQPLSGEQTDRLFNAALKKAQDNTAKIETNQAGP